MRKILLFFFVINLFVSFEVLAQWNKGFNFRATSTFVTDGANTTYSIGEAYPVTRNSVTFGWSSNLTTLTRDRNSANDPRLAGIVFASNSSSQYFRVDLPCAGTYAVTLAYGDPGGGQFDLGWAIRDTTTVLDQFNFSGSAPGDTYYDANGVLWATPAGWIASNTPKNYTFSTTEFRIELHNSATESSQFQVIAHLFLSQIGSCGGGAPGTSIRHRVVK